MNTALGYITDNISMLRLRDILDIFIVAYLIYKGAKLVRETRAAQLVKGIVILVVVTQLSGWLQFNSLNYILANVMQVGLMAILIVFQPELRRTLEKVGTSKFSKFFSDDEYDVENVASQISEAADYMASQRIGALMVVERETKLAEIGKTGIDVNADVSAQLLINIFIPNTPLHDGAVIIGENKVKSAACILPLTDNNNINKQLGTRHRAAIGISEYSDCVAVVVSEETGKISLASNGTLTRNLTADTLNKALVKSMTDNKSTDAAAAKAKFMNWTVKKK